MEAYSNPTVAIARSNANGVQLLGTGFFIGANLIATTKHVTNGEDSGLKILISSYKIFEYQDTSNKEVKFVNARIKEIDPIKDICVLEIEGNFTNPYSLSGTDSVVPGNPVAVLGFPHADHGRFVLTQQNTQVGAKILLESHSIKTKHIVLNTQARPGQSGGPVIDGSKAVIGMLIGSYAPNGGGGISLGGVDPHTLHQTTHVISAEYIQEMI
ncbi:serine protease [Alteribacter lacisalsi]|uniref:Serine protease n=1 Tax=Alteribacter lacisalsi TaxID=2045244 RepID=A0A2W0H6L9_9BACI|nr:serine protease [Alteribacter lacisalsi]PYZ96631.1 serine protease [Alteribacter lacisalsi]